MRRWLDEVDAAEHPGGSPGALELIEAVLDAGSWVRWDEPLGRRAVGPGVRARPWPRARERTGLDESVVTGEGRIHGRRVAVVACEFGFLAGSIGVQAAERLVRAVERATDERLPLLASPTSGGTRMQEGTVAFLQMVKISAAFGRHKAAGNPYLVYLRNPTTGGVLASWGSLGHVTVAEPGALIGFLGPRVYQALYGEDFPAGVQTAENLYEHGLVDAVVPPEQIADLCDRALNVLAAPREGSPDVAEVPLDELPDIPAWESITRSRTPTGRACGSCCGTPLATSYRCTAPVPARASRACCSRWPASGERPASCSARTASARRWASRSARPGCARPGAG